MVSTPVTEHIAEATNSARRVSVNREFELSSSAVGGQQWPWIYQLATDFRLEGSTSYDFLQWSVAESGLRLVFASDSAEIYARTTILHGNISSLDPETAVAPVLATTHLRAQPSSEQTLLVRLLPRD